jgi:hypothetical protein
LYSLLICVLLWIKLFFDARYKASLATILITNFSLFATMKIFTKDSWARVYPDEYLDSTYTIDFKKLYKDGYRGILFDIDNQHDNQRVFLRTGVFWNGA